MTRPDRDRSAVLTATAPVGMVAVLEHGPNGEAAMDELVRTALPLRRHDDVSRRSDDLIDSRAMLGMTRFLMNRPTYDQIAERIVLGLLPGVPVRAAVISQFAADGSLNLAGSFGIAADRLDAHRRGSLWDRTPVSDAVRSGAPLLLVTRAEVAERYPWTGEGQPDPVAVWPLSLPDERVGALQVVLDDGADPVSLRIDMSGLAAVLALYLSLMGDHAVAAEPVPPQSARVAVMTTVAPAPAPDRLTDRQLEILKLIARGMTNPQISHRIGFSESTVRQESMAIYRYLAVNSRRDAVKVAQERGLLADS